MSGNSGIYDGCEAEARIYIFSLPAPLPFSGFACLHIIPQKPQAKAHNFPHKKSRHLPAF